MCKKLKCIWVIVILKYWCKRYKGMTTWFIRVHLPIYLMFILILKTTFRIFDDTLHLSTLSSCFHLFLSVFILIKDNYIFDENKQDPMKKLMKSWIFCREKASKSKQSSPEAHWPLDNVILKFGKNKRKIETDR